MGRKTGMKRVYMFAFVVGSLLLVAVIGCASVFFYRTLELEVYTERASYLEEISEQIVSTTDTISSAQWDLATIFSNHLQKKRPLSQEELAAYIAQAEADFGQKGMQLLAFDTQGCYYDAVGNRARWSENPSVISSDAPEQQVEITTLPTTTLTNDQMVFILRSAQGVPLQLEKEEVILSHVAVVRDMTIFNETFQVPFFSGQGENYIITNAGTKVYRGQAPSEVIGNVFNVLRPLESLEFLYGASFETLRQSVADGEKCSLEFSDENGRHYYVSCAPMGTNDWSLLSIVPSDVVSAGMQRFMKLTVIGMGAIALIVIAAVSLALLLVVRYRAGQQRIRQQAQTNTALKEAAQAAYEASRAKSVFLSHMSHDIRTPINGIMGMADIATRNRDDQARVTDCLDKIMSASRHLLSLVNDVLDMSRIESGKVRLADNPFFVDVLLDGCYSVVAGQAVEKGLHLRTDFTGISHRCLRGDELHLRQILINILGNAVKFTPENGEILFSATDPENGNGEAVLTVVISDDGIGMNEEFQSSVFEPFAQAEEGGRSRYQGTGLGMSIVKQLLDLMGGSIQLESALGQGSTFTVKLCLPIEEEPAQTQDTSDREVNLEGLRVLLVEDNELNMEISQYILEECGIKTTAAWNGKEALDLFLQQPPGTYDVVLMDVMMPIMDGLEAARAIRASGKKDAEAVPIVAMTANAYEEDRHSVMEAGMNRHLTKPIERRELIQALCELCNRNQLPDSGEN